MVTAYHVVIETGDELLRTFWHLEESSKSVMSLSTEERMVIDHFKVNHTRKSDGRFVVPLPRKLGCQVKLGESRS